MSKGLNLIMPMAGRGSRFSELGFNVPKPLIEINNYPFFYWATRSIQKFVMLDSLTFVVLQEHIDRFEIDKKILVYFPESNIISIPEVTEGAAITCLRGIEFIRGNSQVLFNDCDHLFKSTDFNLFINSKSNNIVDGALLTFESNSPAYSYLEYDNEGKNVVRTVEKEVVSNDAICGAYYFKTADTYLNACQMYLENCQYSEYYISGVYNEMIRNGFVVRGFKTDYHIPFGIPKEYNEAELTDKYKFFEELL